MRKDVRKNNVYYGIAWSPWYPYDKYEAMKILPELAGIIELGDIHGDGMRSLMMIGCWRDGLRVELRKFLDPLTPTLTHLRKEIENRDFFYRFTVIDTNPQDMRDILFWLIKEYEPVFNNTNDFSDSKRYETINVRELYRDSDEVIENIPHPV